MLTSMSKAPQVFCMWKGSLTSAPPVFNPSRLKIYCSGPPNTAKSATEHYQGLSIDFSFPVPVQRTLSTFTQLMQVSVAHSKKKQSLESAIATLVGWPIIMVELVLKLCCFVIFKVLRIASVQTCPRIPHFAPPGVDSHLQFESVEATVKFLGTWHDAVQICCM